MDPITSAIVTALAAGAVSGLTDSSKMAITDAYHTLKDLLARKFGVSSQVVQAIDHLETKPESVGRQETLQEEMIAVNAEQDHEVLAAARHLLVLTHTQQAVVSKFTVQIMPQCKGKRSVTTIPSRSTLKRGRRHKAGRKRSVNGQEDAEKYRIENQQPVQGQVVGNHNVIHQHFHPSSSIPAVPSKSVWNVPFSHNPFFTGREKILGLIRVHFQTDQVAALSQPQAMSGLGGIGKTQVAIEYAHRYRHDYQAILWTRADSREALISGYVAFALLLDLPQKDEQDQGLVVQAVLRWLTAQAGWLLILDSADDLAIARELLPAAFDGHVLLTTRAQAMGGLAHRLEVDAMEGEVGALLLLRRAGLVAPAAPLDAASPADIALAREITEELGGLPLALDQAGAYLEETQCGLARYLQLYRVRRAHLLQRRGGVVLDHPEPVATTWSLSFEKVEQRSPAAADLRRRDSFLHFDAIPEEIITQGALHLGPWLSPLKEDPLLFDEAIATLVGQATIE
jgi:hypothetical protein